MAQPDFAPPAETPTQGPLIEVPPSHPLDFAGRPDFAAAPEHPAAHPDIHAGDHPDAHAGQLLLDAVPDDVETDAADHPDLHALDHLPVDLSGVPPVDAPFDDVPVETPLFDAPPVDLPHAFDLG